MAADSRLVSPETTPLGWLGLEIREDVRLSDASSQETSLVVQWLRLQASTAEDVSSIPGQRCKIPHAAGSHQKKKSGRKENGGDGMEIRAEDQEAMSRSLLVPGDS